MIIEIQIVQAEEEFTQTNTYTIPDKNYDLYINTINYEVGEEIDLAICGGWSIQDVYDCPFIVTDKIITSDKLILVLKE